VSLVFRDKISCRWVKGAHTNEGAKEGHPPPLKGIPIDSSNVKMVADSHRHGAYDNKHWRQAS